MSIFTKTPYGRKYCLKHPQAVIKHKISDIKCAWQRANKGYCFRDVWDIDHWFLNIVPEMLDEYIKVHNGYPPDTTDEQWVETINKMAKCFRNANKFTTEFVNPYEKEYLSTLTMDFDKGTLECSASEELDKNYHKAVAEKEIFMQKSLDEGMELFHKYFRSLWD